MKKVRRGLALLVAALVVVNSTDFSLLTVNAKEQTAQESDAQALKKTGADTESGQPSDGNGTDDGTYRDEEKNNQTDKGGGTESSSDEKKPSGDTVTGGTGGTESTEQDGSGPETPDPEEKPGSGAPSGNTQKPDGSLPSGNNGTEGSTGGEGPGTETAGQNEDGVSYIVSVDFTDADLSANVTDQSVEIGATLKDVNLPDTVRAVIAGQSETEEMKVREWKIITPAGAAFDTSASEEDENVPKVGFYEFAPVIEPEEGYEWNSTVPDGYGSWDEYLENWMKISVTVGEEKEGKAVAEGGTYTITISNLRNTGYLVVPDGEENAGEYYAYYDAPSKELILLSDGATYIFDGSLGSTFSTAVAFADGSAVGNESVVSDVRSATIQLNHATINGNNQQPTIDFSGVQNAAVQVIGASTSDITEPFGMFPAIATNGCKVTIDAGEGLSISGLDNDSTVNIQGGVLSASGYSNPVVSNTGTIHISGQAEVTINAGMGAAVSGGNVAVSDDSRFLAYGMNAAQLFTANGNGLFEGKMSTPVSAGTTLTISGGGQSYECYFDGNAAAFVTNLPTDGSTTYTITGNNGGRDFKYVGRKDGTGDETSSFVIGTDGLTIYEGIRQIYSPVFWQAHAEKVTFDSAVLVSEVDTNHTFAGGGENYGDQWHTSQGFQLYEVWTVDEDGNKDQKLDSSDWASAFTEYTGPIYQNTVDYQPGSGAQGSTYTYSIDGLKQGYIYYFIPRVVTTAGIETPITRLGAEGGLEAADPVTGSQNHIIEVRPFYLNLPDTISFTYGEQIGDINDASGLNTIHPSLSMTKGETAVESGTLIPAWQEMDGTFYVYRSAQALESAEEIRALTGQQAIWDAGTYNTSSGDDQAWITFVPDDTTAFGLVSQSVTVKVAKRPITISSVPNKTKEYDGTTNLDAGTITLSNIKPLATGGGEISCDSVTNTMQSDGVLIVQSGSTDGLAASFDNKNAGTEKDITINGLSVSANNGKASNYTVAGSITLAKAGEITKREMTVKPKDETIQTGESLPSYSLEVVGDKTWGVGDTLTSILGGTTCTTENYPADGYQENENLLGGQAVFNVMPDLKESYDNYEFTEENGTLTVIQQDGARHYAVAQTPNADGWYKDAQVVFSPKDEAGYTYDQIRIGTKNGDAIVWGEWQASYTYTESQENLVIQAKNSQTGAFTSYVELAELKIDSKAPEIESVTYEAQNQTAIGSLINFVTFGNFFNEKVVVKVKLKDNLSGPAKLEYAFDDGTYQAADFDSDTNTATFMIPAEDVAEGSSRTVTVRIRITDKADNQADVNLIKEDGDPLESSSWTIDKTLPAISVTASGTSQTGADGKTWFTGDVTISAALSDTDALWKLEEQAGTDEESVTKWTADMTSGNAEADKEHTYTTGAITENTNGTTYTYTVYDLAGNTAQDDVTIYIDRNDPVISNAAVNPSGFFNDAAQAVISFQATDEGSGIYSVQVGQVKDGTGADVETPTYQAAVEGTDGSYTFNHITAAGIYEIVVTDNAGRKATATVEVKLDKEKPVISDVAGAPVEDTWSGTDVTLTISAADAEPTLESVKSGLAKLQYKIDGDADWTDVAWPTEDTGSVNVTISRNGKNTVIFQVVDNARNTSEQKTVEVWIDKTVPELDVTAALRDSSEEYVTGAQTNEPVDFTLNVSNESDIASELTYWVKKGDGEWTEISAFVDANDGYSWDETKHIFTVGHPTEGNFAVDDTFAFKVTTESEKEDAVNPWSVKVSIVDLAEPVITLENALGTDGWYNENNTNPLTLHVSKVQNEVAGSAEITTYYKWVRTDVENSKETTVVVTDNGGTEFTFPGSGTYTVTAWAEDTAGNKSDDVVTADIRVDAVKPEFGTVTYNNVNNTEFAQLLNSLTFGIFYNESVEVTVAASDDYSGVDKLTYQIGEGAPQTVTKDTGSDTFQFKLDVDTIQDAVIKLSLYDKAGNVQTQNLGVDLSDEDAPIWTLETEKPAVTDVKADGTAIEAQENVWYNAPVTVTATVTDEKSGLKEIRYDFGDGDQVYDEGFDTTRTYQHEFEAKVTAEGKTDIWIEAEDLAGNTTEQRSTGTVRIDTQGPKISEVAYSPDKDWTNENLTASFTVTDPGKDGADIETSGVKDVTVERIANGFGASISAEKIIVIDNGNGSYSYTVEKNGTYRITATDNAGNTTVSDARVTNIDKQAPTETIAGKGLQIRENTEHLGSGDNIIYTVDVPVDIYVNDPAANGDFGQSGIKEYYYEYNYENATADQQPVSDTVQWDENGTNTVLLTKTGTFILKVTVYDNAGNQLELQSEPITINNGKYSLDVTATEYDGTATAPYSNNTWSDADRVVYHLGLSGGDVQQEGDYPRYWVKEEGSTSFTELTDGTAGWDNDAKTYTVSGEGIHEFTFRVTNANNANANDTQEYTCKLDRTAPANVEAEAKGTTGTNDWFIAGEGANLFPGIYLSRLPQEDDDNQKAPVQTEYRIWTGGDEPDTWEIYTANRAGEQTLNNLIEEDGIYTFKWKVTDEAGNESAEKTITIKVDTTAAQVTDITVETVEPGLLEIISNAFGNFTNQKVKVTVTATDAKQGVADVSGLYQLKYQIEGGSPITVDFGDGGTASFEIDPETANLYSKGISISIVDQAGNESPWDAVTKGTGGNSGRWTVENMAPTLDSFEANGTKGEDDWYISPVAFDWEVSDEGGIAEVKVTKTTGTVTEDWDVWTPELDHPQNADIDSIVGYEKTKTTAVGEQGTFTFALSAKDIAGNETAEPQEIAVKIDTVAPVIGAPTLVSTPNGDTWTNQDRTYRFTLTDVTSGINADSIQITCTDAGAGTVTATEVTDVPGTWEFKAPVNGTYTINVKDKAGNKATPVSVTVEKIDKDAPGQAGLTLIPSAPNESGWYTQMQDAHALISPVAQDAGQSANHTYYILQKEGEAAAQEIEVTQINTHVTIESGSWTLTVLTRDEAGNECEEEDKIVKSVKVDNELPQIDTDGITFTDSSRNPLKDAIQWLSFGNFFNEEVTVTVPVSDRISHLKSFWYQIGNDEPQEISISGGPEEREVSFAIPVQKEDITRQAVKIWVEDIAGNTSDQNVTLTGNGNSGEWMIEQDAPTLDVEVDDYNNVYNEETGWYQGAIRITGTAHDTDSGLNQVIWKRSVKANESAAPETKDVAALSGPGNGQITVEQTYTIDLTDGIHEVSLWAMDNSTNEAKTEPLSYKVDGTEPELSVTLENSDEKPVETPINEPQSVVIKVDDATSGIKYGSLSISYVDEEGVTHDLKRYEDEGTAQDDGYVIVEALQEAHFLAIYKGTYTITIADNAGNETSYSFYNNMVETIQGNEKVTVNSVPAVNTESLSPWYNAVPLITITSESNDTAAVKTYYYLANPVEDELLGSGESVIEEGSVFQNVQINSRLEPGRVRSFEVTAAEKTETATVDKDDFLVDGADRDGVYILYAQSIDEAGSIGNMTKYYMRIDRGYPEITDISGADSTEWAQERTVTFHAIDVPANEAGQYDVSGIRTRPNSPGRNVVVESPSGAERVYEVSSNSFTYTAKENGTYKITVSDNINAVEEDGVTKQQRHTVTEEFTITNIDTKKPDNATISLDNETEGNTLEGNLWYKETVPTIVVTPPAQPTAADTDASPITTHYSISCNGSVKASGEIVPDKTDYEYKVDENGTWVITTWTVDAAGNESEPKEQTVTYYIDTAAPNVLNTDDDKIVIESIENSGVESFINALTFGVFFKEGIKVTVPTAEATVHESGVSTLWYSLNGGAETKAEDNHDGTFSFIIDEEFSGTIDLITEDNAGNKGEPVRMYNDIVTGGAATEDTWVVDLEKPVITVTTDAKKSDYGWYNDDVGLTVTAGGGDGENVSGINKITWTLQKEGGAAEQKPDLYSNPVKIEKTVTENTTLDKELNGKYTAVFDAQDNALNRADTVTQQYWIDSGLPQIGNIQNPADWMQEKVIEFTVSDDVSGIRADSIKVVLVNDDGTETEQAVTKTAGNILVPEDADTGLGAVADSYTCSFTVQVNGTYKVTFRDAADNEATQEIEIDKIDRTAPVEPEIRVNNSADIQTWYKGDAYPTVAGVKNAADDEEADIAPVKTLYQMWNMETETEPAAAELIQEGNSHTAADAPELTKDGQWKVVMWNIDAAGNVSEKVEAEFGVDTVNPVITDETEQPASFVQHMDAEFILTDSRKEGAGHGEPSGIDFSTLEVTFDPEGAEEAYEVDADDIQLENGIYKIDTTVNGTYTINVKDKAGNPAQEVTITLDKISSVKPLNAELEIQGTKGVIGENETGWYLYDETLHGVNLRFTTLTPPGEGVRVDVNYLLWKDGEGKPDDSQAVTTQTWGADQTVDRLIDEGGIWHLEYWTVSESGLESASRGTATIQYDPEDSRIVEEKIEYRDINNNPAAQFINWLTFGTFFNEAVKVKVPVEDDFSGTYQLAYEIGKGENVSETGTANVKKDTDGSYYAEFTIPVGTKGKISLTLTDNAGNVSAAYTMKSLNDGQETIWTIENQLPTAESVNPKLQDSDITVIEVEGVTGEPLIAVDLKFSERVQWMEGGRVTISTATETYTYTYSSTDADGTADQIPLEEDETKASEATIPLEKFVNENGGPLELELDQTYTMVVEQGAFMDYATNVNERTLLSAFQTQKSASLPPEMLQPVLDLELDVDAPESITMNPDFDPETTGYVIVVDEEAMAGDAIAEDIGFVPTLRDDAEVISAVLTDMLGSPVLDEDGNAISYAINGDGTFTVPKEDIRANENYFVRMTASRYGIETVYNFMISTSAYSEVVTLATSGMTKVEAEGLSGVADFDSLLQGGKKLIIQLIASIPREETAEKSLEAVKAVAGGKKGYYSLDLEINQFLSDGVNTVIEETDNPVTITFTLPAELRGKDTYEVYRNHDGAVTRLKCTLSADGTKLTFASDKFSFFTIAYTPYEEEGPEIEYVEVPGDRVYIDRPGDTAPGSHTASAGGVRTTTAGEMSARAAEAAEAAEIAAQQRELEEQESAQGGEGGTEAVSEDDLKSMFPQGLALVNLAVMVVSMLLTEYSYCRQKKMRKLIGSGLSILLILLFFLTQPLKGLIGMVDEWTIAFIIIGVIHLIATAIPTRRDDEDDGDHGESDSKDSSETEDALRV